MADYTLTPRTAFGETAPQVVTHGTATLTERPDAALACVAARLGQGPQVAAQIEAHCGAPCPVSTYVQGPTLSAFWAGPDQWFVMADDEPADAPLSTTLKTALGASASVTEQSGGWVVFDLTGKELCAVLERLCNIDLSAFGPGRAQRTVIEHISCFVLCAAPDAQYRLLCGRSFASSFAHALARAMQANLRLK